MILPNTYPVALAMLIVSILCWGSWVNTYKLAKWRYEVYYFDFALGVLMTSVLLAFTFGNLGFDGFNFLDDMMHAGKRQWLYGFGGGVIFNLANMLLMASTVAGGMAVAFPIGIGVGLLVLSLLNYFIRPAGNPTLLFGGCLLVLAAVIVDAAAHSVRTRLRHEALARAGKAASLRRPGSLKAVILAVLSGLLMGIFVPMVSMAQESDIGLGPYSVVVVFAVGVFISSFVFSLFFMNLPVEGDPAELRDYFLGTAKQHLMGLSGGALWCCGAAAVFVAAGAPQEASTGPATYATAQASALVTALWGLLAWKEFQGADLRTRMMLTVTLVLFACGLALVSLAPALR